MLRNIRNDTKIYESDIIKKQIKTKLMKKQTSPKVENKDSFGKIRFTEEEWAELNNRSICKGSDATSSQTDENGKPLTYWGGVDFTNKNAHLIKSNTTTSSQTEISDEDIEEASEDAWSDYEYEEGNLYSTTFKGGWKLAIKWYREQLKNKQ